MRINFNKMRPCIKEILLKGQREKTLQVLFKDTRKKMTFYIIHDLQRIGIDTVDIKQELLKWNKKCISPFTPGDAKRQLCDFVDWFFKKECKLTCRAIEDFGLCLFHEGSGCHFQKKAEPRPLTYLPGDARLYLERTFQKYGRGFKMGCVLEALLKVRNEKEVDVLFVGLRTLCAVLFDIRAMRIETKELSKELYRLQDLGFIRITRGQKGGFGFRLSNAYRFLDWQKPEDTA